MSIFRKGVIETVNVIRYGNKRWVKCGVCGSLLEYEKEDVKTEAVGMNEYAHWIVCPICQEMVSVHF